MDKNNGYVLISVEPSKKDSRLSTIALEADNINNFMITTLASIMAISKKMDIEYDDLLKLFIALLREDEVVDIALNRLEDDEDEEDTLF